LSVCAYITSPFDKAPKPLNGDEPMVALFQSKSGTGYIKVLSPEQSKEKHLHIDCILKKAFAKDYKVETSNKNADVKSYIAEYYNTEVDVTVTGGFCLPINKVSKRSIIYPFIKAQKDKGKTISLQLTKGELSITGIPLTEINWTIDNKNKEITILLVGDKSFKVGNKYLLDVYHWIGILFKLFILK